MKRTCDEDGFPTEMDKETEGKIYNDKDFDKDSRRNTIISITFILLLILGLVLKSF